FQAEDGIRDFHVTGVQTCALPIWAWSTSTTPPRAPRPGATCSRSRPTSRRRTRSAASSSGSWRSGRARADRLRCHTPGRRPAGAWSPRTGGAVRGGGAVMLSVGLTGGIGAGKSEVSRLLVERGAVLIDADRIAREVVAPGTPGLAAVVETFGEEVLAEDGSLDRARLGSIVFADQEKLAALNSIVHPLVGARSKELSDAAPEDAVVVHDVPLLTENGLAPLYDLVVVVDASPGTQLDRLVRLRGVTEEDARARMAAQATREQRRAVADIVIDNDVPLDELTRRVDEVWAELVRRAKETRSRPGQE